MDKLEQYRKVRRRIEIVSGLIAIIIGEIISSELGIYDKKFFSVDTALSLAIVVVISIVLSNLSVRIADKWYYKNTNR